MHIRAPAVVCASRPHGETAVVVRLLTADHGVLAGYVAGGSLPVLVVGLLVAFGLIPAAAVPTIIPQAIAELVIAAILTPLVVRGVNLVRSGRTSATDTTPRDKSSF